MGLFNIFRKMIKQKNNREQNEIPSQQKDPDKINNQLIVNLIKQPPLNDADKKERVASLTAREKDIYLLLIKGFTLKEAAAQTGIKYSTANTHMTGIYRKLSVNTRAELIINYRSIEK